MLNIKITSLVRNMLKLEIDVTGCVADDAISISLLLKMTTQKKTGVWTKGTWSWEGKGKTNPCYINLNKLNKHFSFSNTT